MPVSKERITDLLRLHPKGLKARQIANLLNAEKRAVNSILYKYEGTSFVKDENYIWKLRTVPVIKNNATPASNPNTKNSNGFNKSHDRPHDITYFEVAGCYYHRKEIETVFKGYDFNKGPISGPGVLVPEPNNQFDPNAIQVMMINRRTQKLLCVGYVPKDKTKEFSRLTGIICNASVIQVSNSYSITVSIDPAGIRNSISDSIRAEVTLLTNQNRTANVKQRSATSFDFNWIGSFAKKCFYVILIGVVVIFLKNNLPLRSTKTNSSSQETSSIQQKYYNERRYDVSGSVIVNSNDKVGSEWNVSGINVIVNGVERGCENILLKNGDEFLITGFVEELDDDYPDYSEFTSKSHLVTAVKLQKDSFEINDSDIDIFENNGPYRGHKANVNVVLKFTPQD